jgi:hypothetical protein
LSAWLLLPHNNQKQSYLQQRAVQRLAARHEQDGHDGGGQGQREVGGDVAGLQESSKGCLDDGGKSINSSGGFGGIA